MILTDEDIVDWDDEFPPPMGEDYSQGTGGTDNLIHFFCTLHTSSLDLFGSTHSTLDQDKDTLLSQEPFSKNVVLVTS